MTRYIIYSLLILGILGNSHPLQARQQTQKQNKKIDSLVLLLKNAGTEWNDYAEPLIMIGEPAVPALLKIIRDKKNNQWSRKVASMTLANMHSSKTIDPCLEILFDETDDLNVRNGMAAILRGFDLSDRRKELWELFLKSESWTKINVARLLDYSDPVLAYEAYEIIYEVMDGYPRQQALIRMMTLRPEEKNIWLMKGLQNNDWNTSNLAMDSLVVIPSIDPSMLYDIFHDPSTPEEIRWRVTYVFSTAESPESEAFLDAAKKDSSWLVRMEAHAGLERIKVR